MGALRETWRLLCCLRGCGGCCSAGRLVPTDLAEKPLLLLPAAAFFLGGGAVRRLPGGAGGRCGGGGLDEGGGGRLGGGRGLVRLFVWTICVDTEVAIYM